MAEGDVGPLFGAAAPLVFGQKMVNAKQSAAKEEELSYALAAARRTEKRRVVSFVCLCDFIIAATMRSLLVAAVDAALRTTAGAPPSLLCCASADVPSASLLLAPRTMQENAAQNPRVQVVQARRPCANTATAQRTRLRLPCSSTCSAASWMRQGRAGHCTLNCGRVQTRC